MYPKLAPVAPPVHSLDNDEFVAALIDRFKPNHLGGSRRNLILPIGAAEEYFDLEAMGHDCLVKGNEVHCPGKSGTVGFHPIGETVQWTTCHMDDLKKLLSKHRRQTTT